MRPVADQVGLFQGPGQARREFFGNFGLDVGNQRDEFVPARTTYDVARPQTFLQALCRYAKQLVTDFMTVLVINLLEIVQIDKQ